MLKRPTTRRRSKSSEVQINLVPILDAMVTLIAFLLFSMSFLNLVHIESPSPEVATKDLEQKLKERPLQLTVSIHEKDVEIWSPFDKFPAKTIPSAADGTPDFKIIHSELIALKQKFLTETKAILVPHSAVSYDVMVAVMDSIRTLEPTDPPLFGKDAVTGQDTPLKTLFPEIVFGNLLGDS